MLRLDHADRRLRELIAAHRIDPERLPVEASAEDVSMSRFVTATRPATPTSATLVVEP